MIAGPTVWAFFEPRCRISSDTRQHGRPEVPGWVMSRILRWWHGSRRGVVAGDEWVEAQVGVCALDRLQAPAAGKYGEEFAVASA